MTITKGVTMIVKFETIYNLFVAYDDNGDIRFGEKGGLIFTVPNIYEAYEEIDKLTPHDIEEYFDNWMEKYVYSRHV